MEEILVLDKIGREYPGRVAVDDVSFSVKRGSIHGFLGPNGAGKSTTIKMIAGLLPPTSGKIRLFDKLVNPDDISMKNLVGLLPENPPLYLDMKVNDYLKFVAQLHGIKNPKLRIDKVIEQLKLVDVSKRLIGNLSKGFKQRVGLAQALVYDPQLVILDEPTNGLDPQTVVEFRDIIKGLSKEKTILFSSHILSEVEQVCDQITIIHKGRVRASGDLQQIHRSFRQGLCIKLGLGVNQQIPDLSQFGKYYVNHHSSLQSEEIFLISFENEKDIRPQLAQFILSKNLQLMTLQIESPELEDIFLHMTESRQ
jgi:ABC-2 type transport system ATP-binding protein